MIRNHFKISLRNLSKHRLFTAIKLTGLTVGIAACLLIGLYLQHELAYDGFHEKADRIVRVTMEYRNEGETQMVGVTGNKVVPAFRRDFPEVESGVRINQFTQVVRYADQFFEEENFYYADSTFFDIFTFPLLAGDPKTALASPKQVVLTERMAQKYFGDNDPLGKILKVGSTGEYLVSGVMADAPSNSHLQPDFVGSLISLRDLKAENANWWNANYGAYLLLHQAESRAAVEAKIPGYMQQHAAETRISGDSYLGFRLEPLRSVHLYSRVDNKFEANGDIRYLYILGAVGLFVLLIGGITYVNLSTAVSTERAREVGVQKVLGAGRAQLFGQHMAEAGVLTGVALLLGYALAAPLLPLFNQLIDRPLSFQTLFQPGALGLVAGFCALIGLLAGAYPALVLSGFQPVSVLKGQFKFSRSGAWLRKSLIVLQFAISAFLIICTLVLQQQMHFIQNKKLGFEKTHVLALATDQQVVEKIDAFKSEFQQNRNIRSASLVYESPIQIRGGYGIDKSVTGDAATNVVALPVDQDFIQTMQIRMLAGSALSRQDVETARRRQSGLDTLTPLPVLINAAQAHLFGWFPEECIDKNVNFNGNVSVIRGVMDDFHFSSMHEQIGPLVVFPDTWGNTLLVKLNGEDMAGTLRFLENKWTALAPHRPFQYHFLDEEFDKLYKAERQTALLISTFSGLAIFLACLGLFGLATYAIVQRTKEIGVRKVLGASVEGLVRMLSKEFILLVLAGLLLAAPIAWYLLREWLSDFQYRIELEWWVFALAGALSVVVAFLTISLQSVKAAVASPINALRSE